MMTDEHFQAKVKEMVDSIKRNGKPNCSLVDYGEYFNIPIRRRAKAAELITVALTDATHLLPDPPKPQPFDPDARRADETFKAWRARMAEKFGLKQM